MKMRPYQEAAVAAVLADWRQHPAVLGVAATGAGKTQMFLEILRRQHAARPGRSLVIAHRQELIDQPIERAQRWDGWTIPMGKVMAEHDDCSQPITVATVQTLSSQRRIARLLAYGPIDTLVVDETHHATADSYLTLVERLRAVNPDLRILGVTATPMRADGDGLSRLFEHVSFKVTIADLVKQGYLVQPRWLGIATGISLKGVESRAGDYVQSQLASRYDTPEGRRIITHAWHEYAQGRRTIAFTASVAGAHALAEEFNAQGVPAAAVDGTTPRDERARILDAYRAGQITVLANCQVLTEGFDAPGTSCILMCRPTKSDSLYVQCMGRGLRPALGMSQPGEDCLILDFMPEDSRNIVMAGDVLGIPKDQAKAARELLEEAEPGEVQLGFTFDGERFDSSGTPLEIIARQLDYLQMSPWVWERRDGWLTLGLGKGADGLERILAITPPDEHGRSELWGLGRAKGERVWSRRKLAEGTLDELGEQGNELAEKHGAHVLIGKGRTWQAQPATEGQVGYLKKLAPRDQRKGLATLTKGQAAALITHYQARSTLFDVR
jgi:superfamily II DNA or RNA helicase